MVQAVCKIALNVMSAILSASCVECLLPVTPVDHVLLWELLPNLLFSKNLIGNEVSSDRGSTINVPEVGVLQFTILSTLRWVQMEALHIPAVYIVSTRFSKDLDGFQRNTRPACLPCYFQARTPLVTLAASRPHRHDPVQQRSSRHFALVLWNKHISNTTPP